MMRLCLLARVCTSNVRHLARDYQVTVKNHRNLAKMCKELGWGVLGNASLDVLAKEVLKVCDCTVSLPRAVYVMFTD